MTLPTLLPNIETMVVSGAGLPALSRALTARVRLPPCATDVAEGVMVNDTAAPAHETVNGVAAIVVFGTTEALVNDTVTVVLPEFGPQTALIGKPGSAET